MYIDGWLWAFTRGVRARIAGATAAGLLSVLVGTARLALLGWVLGCTFIYSTLFGAGSMLYGYTTQAAVFVLVWIISGGGLLTILRKVWSA